MFIDTEVHLVVDIACMNRGGWRTNWKDVCAEVLKIRTMSDVWNKIEYKYLRY